MRCEEFVRELSAFRDDELSRPDDARAREHLAAGRKCRTYLRDYEITIELAKALPPIAPKQILCLNFLCKGL
jgi:anti-sigma factor RsiW